MTDSADHRPETATSHEAGAEPILSLPAVALRRAVQQLAVAERLRGWHQSNSHAPVRDVVLLDVASDRVTLSTPDDRVRFEIPREPSDRMGQQSGVVREGPTQVLGLRNPDAPALQRIQMPLWRLREAVASQPITTRTMTLTLGPRHAVLSGEVPAVSTYETLATALLGHAVGAASRTADASDADPARRAPGGPAGRLPLPLAWSVRLWSLDPTARSQDTVLRTTLAAAARELDNRSFEFFGVQLKRWARAAESPLSTIDENARTALARDATARLAEAPFDSVDLDETAALALIAHVMGGEGQRPPAIVRSRASVAAVLRTLHRIAVDAASRSDGVTSDATVVVLPLLPSEATRAEAVAQRPALRVAARLWSDEGIAERRNHLARLAPAIGDPERESLAVLAQGRVRECDASYALTMAEVPRAARTATLLAVGHPDAERRLAALTEDDRIVARTLARLDDGLLRTVPPRVLDQVSASLERAERAERSAFYGEGARKRREATGEARSDRVADYVPEACADAAGRIAGAQRIVIAYASMAVPETPIEPSPRASRDGSLPRPAVLATRRDADQSRIPVLFSSLPPPQLGLVAVESGVPVWFHLPTRIALVATPDVTILSHSRALTAARYDAFAAASPDDLIAFGGEELVLLHACERSVVSHAARDTPDEIRSGASARRTEETSSPTLLGSGVLVARHESVGTTITVPGLLTLRVGTRWEEARPELAQRAINQVRHWSRDVIVPERSGPLDPPTADRVEAALGEVRAMRPARDLSDYRTGVQAERVAVAVEHNATTGSIVLVGGGPTHGYLERRINVEGTAPWFTASQRARTRSADVDADAWAMALGVAREFSSTRALPQLAVHEASGQVSLRTPTMMAVVAPLRPPRVRAREDESRVTDGRAMSPTGATSTVSDPMYLGPERRSRAVAAVVAGVIPA